MRTVKKPSVSSTRALSPVTPLKNCLAFSRILAMKKNALLSIAAVIIASSLSACKPANPVATSTDKEADTGKQPVQAQAALVAGPAVKSIESILGSYVGQFGDNKITLLITKAGEGTVVGRTIVGGNDRPF